MTDAIICDIDGTLARRGDRSPYDWERVGEDMIDETVREILETYHEKGCHLIFVSGRKSVCMRTTKVWLRAAGFESYSLFMRHQTDDRPDQILKKEIYEEYIKGKYNILFVLDDRDKVVKMWREQGLKCLQVDYGNF